MQPIQLGCEFPEVRNRIGTEGGLHLHARLSLLMLNLPLLPSTNSPLGPKVCTPAPDMGAIARLA